VILLYLIKNLWKIDKITKENIKNIRISKIIIKRYFNNFVSFINKNNKIMKKINIESQKLYQHY
jgi:hypothetical protein